MNNKYRCLNAMRGKNTDRISVMPAIDLCYAASFGNYTISECFCNPKAHAAALENCLDKHIGVDGVYINVCLSQNVIDKSSKSDHTLFITDIAGNDWAIPQNDVGSVKKHSVVDLSDSRIKTANPLKDGIIETYDFISNAKKSDYLIIPGLTGAFCQMVFLFGLQEVIFAMYDNTNALKKALEYRTHLGIKWADEYIKRGVDCVWIGEGPASNSVISKKDYEEFVLPYTTPIVKHLNNNGVTTIMHVCGDINNSAPSIAKTGVCAMDIDYMVDLQSIRKSIPKEICLRGNLNPIDLQNMSEESLIHHCENIIKKGAAGGSFVLSTGCLVTRDTPKENIDCMVQASKNLTENPYEFS